MDSLTASQLALERSVAGEDAEEAGGDTEP